MAHHKLWNLPAWNVGDSTCVDAHIWTFEMVGSRKSRHLSIPAWALVGILWRERFNKVAVELQQACVKRWKQPKGSKQLLRIRQGRQKGVSLQAAVFGKRSDGKQTNSASCAAFCRRTIRSQETSTYSLVLRIYGSLSSKATGPCSFR